MDWNATSVSYPSEGGVHDLVSRQAARAPAAVAALCSERQLTFTMLERRSNQLANVLREQGIRRGTRVGMLLERSMDVPVVLVAILKAGAAYVALDPSSPRDRLAFQVQDSSPAVIVTSGPLAGSLPEGPHHLVRMDVDAGTLDEASPIAPDVRVHLEDPAYVVYTSGSTGVPKGVLVPHSAFLNHMRWFAEAFPLAQSDRMLHKYSVGFDVASVEIFAPLIAGAGVVVAPPAAHLDVDVLVDLISQHEVTAIDVVPSQLALFVEHPAFRECHSLRRITCGGEVLPPALAERVLASLSVELHNIYGPTEATISATSWTCQRGSFLPTLPVGRPIANVRAYILDMDSSPVPIGVPGELVLGGAGVAIGYLNAPELTAAKFVRDPFDAEPGARMYKTGDRARFLPDGNIEFLGRLDTQVKIRGFRVEPGEIEAVLASHPSVDSCAVTAWPDARGEPQLVAYIAHTLEPELWPSVGESFLYDPLLYHAMTNDTLRNEKYQAAMARLVRGKTVVDVGTGADALLARFAVEAGARRVYAIEMLEESYLAARDRIATLGLVDRIQLVLGDARQVSLPEPVDVCVSELLGMIASSEGAGVILSDALRFLKPNGVMIPLSSATHIAAVSLPERLRSTPRFTQISGSYTQKIFERVGFPFDVRICIDHARRSWLTSNSGVFESLDFARRIPSESHLPVSLRVTRDAEVDGFLLWLTAETIAGHVIDVLDDEYHWLPVFFPVFTPPVSVSAGDTFELLCSVVPSAGGLTPDYRVSGRLLRLGAPPLDLYHASPHTGHVFRGNGFYDLLFAQGFAERFVEPVPKTDAPALKAYLSRTLPDYMLPAHLTSIASIPLTATGKIDRRKVPPQRAQTVTGPPHRPQTNLERSIAENLAGSARRRGGRASDNFFDLGGHSMLVIRAQSRLREQLKQELAVVDLFRYPTIAGLAKHLATRAPVA